jgi:hypothetical protein
METTHDQPAVRHEQEVGCVVHQRQVGDDDPVVAESLIDLAVRKVTSESEVDVRATGRMPCHDNAPVGKKLRVIGIVPRPNFGVNESARPEGVVQLAVDFQASNHPAPVNVPGRNDPSVLLGSDALRASRAARFAEVERLDAVARESRIERPVGPKPHHRPIPVVRA